MKRNRFTVEQIIRVLHEVEVCGRTRPVILSRVE